MNEIESTAARMVALGEAAFREAGALAVAYAFSFFGAVLLLIVGYIAAGLIERWLYRVLGRMKGVDETLRRFLSKTLRYAILILVGVTVLAQFGVQTASIIAALGAAGIAIGLALQGTLQNIAAGIMLLVLRPFRVGEYITSPEASGTVEEVGLFATELKALDGTFVFVPNGQLWNTAIINYSRNPLRRAELSLAIAYDDDIELARSLLVQMADKEARVLDEPAPLVYVAALAETSVTVTLQFWTTSADNWQTQVDLTARAKALFTSHGLSVAPIPNEVRLASAIEKAVIASGKGQRAVPSRRGNTT